MSIGDPAPRHEAVMIELVDLKETRHDCPDLSGLQSLLKQLHGQPFRFFRVSYGDELRLHLGDLQGYSSPRMQGRSKGAYMIGARASSWLVFSAPRLVLASSEVVRADSVKSQVKANLIDIKLIETGDFITPGAMIMSANADRSAHGFSLRLGFSDGSSVLIHPDSEVDEEIADWEVLTPHQRILTVGKVHDGATSTRRRNLPSNGFSRYRSGSCLIQRRRGHHSPLGEPGDRLLDRDRVRRSPDRWQPRRRAGDETEPGASADR